MALQKLWKRLTGKQDGSLSREQLLAVLDRKRVKVALSGEDGEEAGVLYVLEMSIPQRRDYNDALVDASDKDGNVPPEKAIELFARYVAELAVNERGERYFTDEEAAMLVTKSYSVLSQIALTSLGISGITDEAIEEARLALKKAKRGSLNTP